MAIVTIVQKHSFSSPSSSHTRLRIQRCIYHGQTFLMLAPATGVLLVLYGGALLAVLVQSLGYAPWYGINAFPTLHYYRQLFSAPGFAGAIGLTLVYALIPTGLATVVSIGLAWTLERIVVPRWRWLRYGYSLPLFVPYLVGVALVTLVWANGGLVARLGYHWGWLETTRDFPRILYSRAGWGIMLVYLWKQVPFMTFLFTALLQEQNPEYDTVAATLGAGPWQRLRYITLPQLAPGIVAATLLVFAFNASSFEVPFLLGGGFPETLPVMAWRAIAHADYHHRLTAMALLSVVGMVTGVILGCYLYGVQRNFRPRVLHPDSDSPDDDLLDSGSKAYPTTVQT